MTVWFTADLHIGHSAVIRYARRPFANVDEMNEALIKNWNDCVSPKDDIYVLGDLSFCSLSRTISYLSRLNGRKYWIFGNHDKKLRNREGILQFFEWGKDLTTIKIPDSDAYQGQQRIVLCHYAMRVWDKSHFGTWQLYGHSHGSLPDDRHSLSMDVGVDNCNYRPISYEEIKTKMKLKTWKPIDHHGDRDEY